MIWLIMSLNRVLYSYDLSDEQRQALEAKFPESAPGDGADLSEMTSVELWSLKLTSLTSHAHAQMRPVMDAQNKWQRRVYWMFEELIVEFTRDPA